MDIITLIDFGSTYTKAVAISKASKDIIGIAQSETTIQDITIGFAKAISKLESETKISLHRNSKFYASSSAAGGLRIIAIGLIPELTAEAAKRAALGAGAKIIRVFSHELNQQDILEIEKQNPDIILLAGGTDGGNKEVILQNANRLLCSIVSCPIIVAGNRVVSDQIYSILHPAKEVFITENVMPKLGELNIEPTRNLIREVFIKKITVAKGLDKIKGSIEGILMPTPMAVLKATELLATGVGNIAGMGEVVVVDIGGATTDVHSACKGESNDAGTVIKGLPEPFAKRTVEGDLGIRYNASTIVDLVGIKVLSQELAKTGSEEEIMLRIQALARDVNKVPTSTEEYNFDTVMATFAANIAMRRHAGTIETVQLPDKVIKVQYGKDLTEVKTLVGTGGIFAYGQNTDAILKGCLYSTKQPFSLCPREPRFYIDKRYIFYAIGLLAELDPELALAILNKNLLRI